MGHTSLPTVSFLPKVKHKGFDESMFPDPWVLGPSWGGSWGLSIPALLPCPVDSVPVCLLQTKAGSYPDQ